MVVFACGEACVIEDEGDLGGAGLELEVDDGVDACVPVCGAPGLDDALAGDKLDVAADDEAAEEREGSAGAGIDGGGKAGKGGELLLVEEGLIEALGGGLEVNFVVDGSEIYVGRCGGAMGHRRFLCWEE